MPKTDKDPRLYYGEDRIKKMKEHIVSTYDDDLNTLKTKLLEMGV